MQQNGAIVAINSGQQGGKQDHTWPDIFADITVLEQRIEQTLRDWEGGLEVGIDRPGLDLTSLNTSSAASCQTECAKNSLCMSPHRRPARTCSRACDRGWEINVDRPGLDIAQYTINGPLPERCQAACEQRSDCYAWTLATSVLSQTTQNIWYLKSGVPGPSSLFGAISGRRGMAFF